MKKLLLLFLVFLLLLSGCGKNTPTRAAFKEPVEYGGHYKLKDEDVILLAVEPALQAEMGLGDYDCENCAERWNSNCNHLSPPISPDSPEFAQLPEEVRDAALQFQAEPPDPLIGKGASLSFQLTRFSYDYLKSVHKKLHEEWVEVRDDPESFWAPIEHVTLREERNTVVFSCYDMVHTEEREVDTQELAAYLRKTKIDMRALRVRHVPLAYQDLPG